MLYLRKAGQIPSKDVHWPCQPKNSTTMISELPTLRQRARNHYTLCWYISNTPHNIAQCCHHRFVIATRSIASYILTQFRTATLQGSYSGRKGCSMFLTSQDNEEWPANAHSSRLLIPFNTGVQTMTQLLHARWSCVTSLSAEHRHSNFEAFFLSNYNSVAYNPAN